MAQLYSKQQLREIFQSPFNQEAWKAILHNLFRAELIRKQAEKFTADDDNEDGYFLGSIPKEIPLRVANRRDLGEVTLVELASGLAALLIRQERRKEELYKEMASLFGYARLGAGIVSRFDEALALLSKHSLALEDVRGYLSFDEEKAKALEFAAMAKRF